MGDNNKVIREFFLKPEDPESTATVLPTYLEKREHVRSSTVDIEYYIQKTSEKEATIITPQTILLSK